MKRKKARKLVCEAVRRCTLYAQGSLKGFGKSTKFYRDEWRPDVQQFGGYKGMWESEIMRELRKAVGRLEEV